MTFLVSLGFIILSINPNCAAISGLLNLSLYSATNFDLSSSLLSAAAISLLCIISTAHSAPITAISPLGHANNLSAPRPIESMTI
jgi:hypothetical protein